jgi:hypothetical protein
VFAGPWGCEGRQIQHYAIGLALLKTKRVWMNKPNLTELLQSVSIQSLQKPLSPPDKTETQR